MTPEMFHRAGFKEMSNKGRSAMASSKKSAKLKKGDKKKVAMAARAAKY